MGVFVWIFKHTSHSIRKVRKKQIKIPLIPQIFYGINGIVLKNASKSDYLMPNFLAIAFGRASL
jgi:hypothetical protein